MSLMRRNWDPFSTSLTRSLDSDPFGFDSMMRRMENLERTLLPDARGGSDVFVNPNVDIKESDDKLQILAEMPGLDKKDIKIDLDEENRVLTLSGERKVENEKNSDTYHVRERKYGSFRRSFTLPDSVKLDQVKANMNQGLLNIEIPKAQQQQKQKQKRRSIDVGENNA
jgi:HSP20 family protein